MSNTVFHITSKKFKSKLFDEKVDVYLSDFFVMKHNLTSSQEKYLENKFKNKEKQLEKEFKTNTNFIYFIENFNSSSKREGLVVYKVNSFFKGYYDEHEQYDLEVIGTLTGTIRNYKIETDLKTVEKSRRRNEYKKMINGKLFIEPFGYDYIGYRLHLNAKDKNNSLEGYCRGHGYSL